MEAQEGLVEDEDDEAVEDDGAMDQMEGEEVANMHPTDEEITSMN